MADNTVISNAPSSSNTDITARTSDSQTATGVIQHMFDAGNFVPKEKDYCSVDYPSDTQEVYTFKLGGSGGTTVATVTVNYTDDTKANLQDVAVT